MTAPLILAFDTSAAHCAAALLAGGRVIDARAEEMGRGQAERLIPLLEELLSDAGYGWADLDRIGVGTGPGNFTGIRISVSAARGLALALDIPAIGVSGLEALRRAHGTADAAIPAPRAMAYLQRGDTAPVLVPESDLPDGVARLDDPAALAVAMAALAAEAPSDSPPPAPLYLRPADAAPARDRPPVILDDA